MIQSRCSSQYVSPDVFIVRMYNDRFIPLNSIEFLNMPRGSSVHFIVYHLVKLEINN